MAGINVSGVGRTKDLTVGRGFVLAAPLNSSDVPGEYRELGNAKSFRITAESETLEHFSSKTVQRTKDAEVALETSADIEIVLDEINYENLALFFSGDVGTHDNSKAGTGFTGGSFGVPNNNAPTYASRAIGGRWYELFQDASRWGLGYQAAPVVDASSARVYDIDDAADISIKTNPGGGGVVTYVGGVDFDVDTDIGAVFVREGSALESDLQAAVTAVGNTTSEFVSLVHLGSPGTPGADGVSVEFTASTGHATTLDEMRALTKSSQNVALKFIQLNANDNGHPTEYQVHKVKLTPNGDFDLLSEDAFAELTLTGAAEANSATDLDSDFITARTVRN